MTCLPLHLNVFNDHTNLYKLVDVVNQRLESADKEQIDYMIEQIQAFQPPETYKYSQAEYFNSLMTRLLMSRLTEDQCCWDKLDNQLHDYEATLIFCKYGTSVVYFEVYPRDKLVDFCKSMTILYSVLEMLSYIRAYTVMDEILNTFMLSYYIDMIVGDPSLLGDFYLPDMFKYTKYWEPENTVARDMLDLLVEAFGRHTDEYHTDTLY